MTETIAKQPLMGTVAYDTGKKDAEGNPIMAEHEVVNSQVEHLVITIQDSISNSADRVQQILD